jgi:hypothetical protein
MNITITGKKTVASEVLLEKLRGRLSEVKLTTETNSYNNLAINVSLKDSKSGWEIHVGRIWFTDDLLMSIIEEEVGIGILQIESDTARDNC